MDNIDICEYINIEEAIRIRTLMMSASMICSERHLQTARTSTSGEKAAVVMPLEKPVSNTYVKKAISGMYRSGEFTSVRGWAHL
jgi:hypothetical protein